VVNVEVLRLPMDEIALTHKTTIKANMTAYSTAVGPSSEARKRRKAWQNLDMGQSLLRKRGNRVQGERSEILIDHFNATSPGR
jgi:hypothetical protein